MSVKLIRQHTAAWASPTLDTDLPYDFVPVALNDGKPGPAPEAPIWHHGANKDQPNLYSGELRCTLTTLSPFFVGNLQKKLKDIDSNFKTLVENTPGVKLADYLNSLQADERPKSKDSAASKIVSFPLMLGIKGAVLIPGEGLKGMYRQGFGALMSSPLQFVSDETYSFRPNANPSTNGVKSRSCAGRIEKINLSNNVLTIELIEDISALEFVHGDKPIVGTAQMVAGNTYGKSDKVTNKTRQAITDKKGNIKYPVRYRWVAGGTSAPPVDYVYLNYHFALDRDRAFMQAAGKGTGIDHPGVLVPKSRGTAKLLIIPPGVVAQYQKTCEHLEDTQRGHAKRNPPVGMVVRPDLAVNDIIFCECRVNATGKPFEVISFGHNFRYRWQHLDSVTQQASTFENGVWQYQPRPELTAHPDEIPCPGSGPQPPAALSAVRNLFGYVAKAGDTSLGDLQKLEDPFNRLAGRVSFNMAMERNASDADDQRFVNADKHCLLFMHPAVEPKASFARAYVPGADATWGDGLAMLNVGGEPNYLLQNGTSEFAGRKFYLHQLDENGVLPMYHYDLDALLAQQNLTQLCGHTLQDLKKFLWSDQSGVAVNVSRAGREFGFTVRFKHLRAWELAALAGVLNPDLLAEAIRADGAERLPRTYNFLTEEYTRKFGLKLGRGKAQGLGSVSVDLDVCELWRAPKQAIINGLTNWLEFIGEHLLPKLDGHDAVVRQWFEVLRLQSGRAVRPYLLHRSGKLPQTIVGYAQKTRQAHAAGSRDVDFAANLANQGYF